MSDPVAAGLVVALGLLFVLVGYLIAVRRVMWLVAGYDQDRVAGEADEAGLARLVGGWAAAVGAGTVAIGALMFSRDPTTAWGVYGVGVLVGTIVVMVLARRYERPEAA